MADTNSPDEEMDIVRRINRYLKRIEENKVAMGPTWLPSLKQNAVQNKEGIHMNAPARSPTQQISNKLEEIVKELRTEAVNKSSDGFVINNINLLRAVVKIKQSAIHLAASGGLTPEEISDTLEIPILEVTETLAEPVNPAIDVGYLVRPKNPSDPLHCGSGMYTVAVVISMEPFVLVSTSGDMRWSTKKAEDFEVIEKVKPDQLEVCMRRLEN